MSTLNQIRTLIKDHLESFEFFDDVVILEGKPKDIGAQIDEGLAKLGLVVIIQPARAGTSRQDLRGPVLDNCEYLLRVYQNLTLDDVTVEALDVAEEIAVRCHYAVLDEEQQITLRCGRDTIELGDDVGNENQPCITWDVPIQTHVMLGAEWEQVATPVIVYDEEGRVQMTCATPGAQIFYTTDGSRPRPGNGAVYTGVIEEVADGSVYQARAYLHGMLVSEIATPEPGEVEVQLMTIQQIIAALNALTGNFKLSTNGDLILQTDDEVVENRTLHEVRATKNGTAVSVVANDAVATLD